MKIQKANQIKFYFILGIALPCILLSYFAYRGVRNDRALMEEKLVTEHRSAVEQLTKEVDDIFTNESQLINDFTGNTSENKYSTNYNSSTIRNSQGLVKAVFRIRSAKQISFLHPKLLYLPDTINHNYILTKDTKVLQLISKARRLEFSDKNYKKAIQVYQSALTQNKENRTKGSLLTSIARVQKKDAQFKNSIFTYYELIKSYDDFAAGNAIPFGLAARIELGSLLLSEKDTSKAMDVYLKAYKNLAEGIWRLQKSQFDLFESMVRDSLEKVFSILEKKKDFFSIGKTFSKLQNRMKTKKQLTDYLLSFQLNGAELVFQKAGWNSFENIKRLSQLFLETQGNKYLINFVIGNNSFANEPTSMLGIIWDVDRLKSQYLNSLFKDNMKLANVYWQVLDKDNEIILKNEQIRPGKMTVKTNFNNNFPPWLIELYQKDAGIIDEVDSLRRSLYFYMLILVAGILGFGLVLTSISITREMELAKLKSDFASTISHELRSPLTSIRQLAEMLQTGRVPSNERRQKYYQVIVEQSEKLSLLINNILDFSKIEEQKRKFDFESIGFGKLLHDILSTIKQRIEHENFVLEIEIDKNLPNILVDRNAIVQVITNLVDNAIKYSDDVKRINISAFVKNNFVYVCVQDFGIGITDHDLHKIYNRYFRGGEVSVRSRTKGSGLGLTLVKQIIDAHNGEIKVKSELGKGSLFTIKLPI
jgi:signal transduction histidine kinase